MCGYVTLRVSVFVVFFFLTVTVTVTLQVPVPVAITLAFATLQTRPVRDVIETLPPLGTVIFNRRNTSDWRIEILSTMSLFAPVLKAGVVEMHDVARTPGA